MTNDNHDFRSRRRPFLKTIGALGVAAAAGPAAASHDASATLDEYHQALRDELTDPSREQKQLPAGTYVYGATEQAGLDAFSLQGGGTETSISVDTDAVPITMGERLDVPGPTEGPADLTYEGRIEDHSFSAGDLLLAVAYVRSDSDGARASASFTYEYTDPDGTTAKTDSFVQRGEAIDPDAEWMRYYFPIVVDEKPDGADHVPVLEFLLGYGEQTVEFGGIALFDYSETDVALGTLPPYDYAGRAEDAEWREAAHERIEEIRKTDIEVEVLNPGGQPMNNAAVEVEMAEHEFDFGSAVSVPYVAGESEDDERYRETFLDDFNKAVVENGLKYPSWEGDWDIDNEDTLATLDWLDDHDVPNRGHYLLWEEFDDAHGGGMSIENPDDLSADELREGITEKIQNHAAEFEDNVVDWDVHNHPSWLRNFRDMDELGWDAIEEWWNAADAATDHPLYPNEMGVVGGMWLRSQYYEYVEHLVENDFPVDGIGFMGHHQQKWNQLLDVEDIISGYDQFAEFGLPILVTEFDVQIFDRRNAQEVEVQKDYIRDFLTVAFSKEAVEGVMSWGFWAGRHWRPTAAYYDEDWTQRAHGEKFQELVFDEWWTEEEGTTGKDGRYTTRGFKGIYTVTAEKGNLSGETTVTFDDETGTVTVELSPASRGNSTDRGNGNANGK